MKIIRVRERKLLVAGMDAGLHTSVSLLDLDGNIVFLKTLKSPRMCELLEIVSGFGKVISISTDRKRPPAIIRRIGASLGSRLIMPDRNMTNKKKRILIGDHLKVRRKLDSHQKAALSSAIFALRKYNRRFKKLKDRMEKEGSVKDFRAARSSLLAEDVDAF